RVRVGNKIAQRARQREVAEFKSRLQQALWRHTLARNQQLRHHTHGKAQCSAWDAQEERTTVPAGERALKFTLAFGSWRNGVDRAAPARLVDDCFDDTQQIRNVNPGHPLLAIAYLRRAAQACREREPREN